MAFLEIFLVFSACHAFCKTACKKPAKQLAGVTFNPALPFAGARSDWAAISRAVGALLRMSALRTLVVVLCLAPESFLNRYKSLASSSMKLEHLSQEMSFRIRWLKPNGASTLKRAWVLMYTLIPQPPEGGGKRGAC